MEKGYFSASVTHGASAARAGSAPHRDQHLHSLMSPVNKKQWLSYRSWNTAWSENSVVKCCMNITNFYCHRLAFYQASLEEVTLACQLMPFGVALCFGLRGKARGGFSVSSKEISGASEQQNQVMICYKGLLCAQDQATASGNCTQSSHKGGSPHTRTSGGSVLKHLHITQESVKGHDIGHLCNIIFFLSSSSFHMKTGLSCMWMNLLLFILYQKSKLSKHHHTVCCHGNDRYATNGRRSSWEETAGVNES